MANGAEALRAQEIRLGLVEMADFGNAGLKNITRIAVSPKGDRIAVVSRQ